MMSRVHEHAPCGPRPPARLQVKVRLSRELLADLEDTSLRLLYTTPESLQMERLR